MNFFKNIIVNLYYFILDSIDFAKQYSTQLILAFVFISGSFIAIREFFYFGTLTIHINEENTKIIIDGDAQDLENESFSECKNNTCTLTLYPSTHQIFIQKNGFTTETQTIDIEFHTNTEIFFQLHPNITKITPTLFTESSGVLFPLKTSTISKKVHNFSIQNKQIKNTHNKNTEYIFYKHTPLFPIQKEFPVYISSDEIGRSVFIASEKKIVRFNTQTKTTEPSIIPKNNKTITAFFPQSNGEFLYSENKNITNFALKTPENPVAQPIEKSDTLSTKIQNSCITPTHHLLFLAHNPLSKKSLEVSLYSSNSLSFKNSNEKTVLANLSLYDISHIECINDNTIAVFLKNKTAYMVEF